MFTPVNIQYYLIRNKGKALRQLQAEGKVPFIKAIRSNTDQWGMVHTDWLNPTPAPTPVACLGLKEAKDWADLIDPNYGYDISRG